MRRESLSGVIDRAKALREKELEYRREYVVWVQSGRGMGPEFDRLKAMLDVLDRERGDFARRVVGEFLGPLPTVMGCDAALWDAALKAPLAEARA